MENLGKCLANVARLSSAYKVGQNLIEETCSFIQKKYTDYHTLCKNTGKNGVSVLSLEHVEKFEWNLDSCKEVKNYFEQLLKVPKNIIQAFFSQGNQLIAYHVSESQKLAGMLQRGCMMQQTALEDYMGMLCGDGMDNLFMLYMELLKHSNASTKAVQELMDGINSIIEFCSNLELSIKQKMYLEVEERTEKYRQLYENIAGFYQNTAQSTVNVAMMTMTGQVEDTVQKALEAVKASNASNNVATNQPAQPTAGPTGAAAKPDAAAAQPDAAVAQPNVAAAQPDAAAAQPNVTAAQPDAAAVKPTGAAAGPDRAAAKPDAAAAQPNNIAAGQAKETVQPNNVAANQAKEAAQPNNTAAGQPKEAAQPENAAAKPAQETVQPDNEAAGSAAEAAQAEEEAAQPDEMNDTQNMLEKLLEYAQLDEEFCTGFRDDFGQYCKLSDKDSAEQEGRKLRKRLSDRFYQLYEAAFFRSEKEGCDNTILCLFLNYGIVDETGFDEKLIQRLQAAAEEPKEEQKIPVYTIREWLRQVYMGNKEPSRNEFDMDYDQYLREEYKGKEELTPEKWEALQGPEAKVSYEIKNFFLMNNRLTNGQLSTFCPVMTREQMEGNVDNFLVTSGRVNEEFLKVLKIDFSVFYRDVMYDDRENGIHNLIIHEEVLPDVVLMPNMGGLGRMWQENSGRRRATPGRFALPVFTRADLYKMVLEMIGSFRWEICKRVQGARWNDVSEPSLTSEYCDYLQFYKKNKDLTDNGKEKIAQLMVKCRNNYGKVFVNHYMSWIMSESLGNMRLDKVSRFILGRYCPFPVSIRARLIEQPMFAEPLGRYERDRKKRLKELNNRRAALRNRNGKETEEFKREFEFFEM